MSSNVSNRQEKVLLGVCSYISRKYNFNPLILRLVFIATILFVTPYVFLIYFLLSIVLKTIDRRTIFAVLGGILGVAVIVLILIQNENNGASSSQKYGDYSFVSTIGGFVLIYSTIIALSFGKMKKIYGFSILGAIIGIPLSYLFQNESIIFISGGGIAGYIINFNAVIENWNLLSNVLLSVIVFLLIGGLLGYFIDKVDTLKNNTDKNK